MPGEERLVVSHVLQGADALSWVNFKHSIDEKKGVPVREVHEDRADVQAERISHSHTRAATRKAFVLKFDPAARCVPKQQGGHEVRC
jgi:hypothetical protein